jgi:single-stranded-DNA-specific exonuclease
MAAAETGVRLLLTEDPAEAEALAAHLDEQNEARRRTDRELTAEVERTLGESFDAGGHPALVVWGEHWHRGVVGIVASRMVDRWRRPAVVVSFDGEVGEGSGRSVEGFHLFDALRECEELLEGFGGHRMAAGLRIRRERIEEFATRLRELAAERLEALPDAPELRIDLELPLAEVDARLADALRHLAPYGAGNPAPVIAVRGVRLEAPATVGEAGRHLRATLRDGASALRAIGFGMGPRIDEVREAASVDATFQLERDVWRGRERLQARLLDLRPAAG